MAPSRTVMSVGAENDPLIQSEAQYMALLEESLSAADAAKLLRVDVSRIRQRLRERSLFGIEYAGSWRLPRFQFERRLVIPGLAQVLKELPSDLFPLDVVDWFLLPEPGLRLEDDTAPRSPRAICRHDAGAHLFRWRSASHALESVPPFWADCGALGPPSARHRWRANERGPMHPLLCTRCRHLCRGGLPGNAPHRPDTQRADARRLCLS